MAVDAFPEICHEEFSSWLDVSLQVFPFIFIIFITSRVDMMLYGWFLLHLHEINFFVPNVECSLMRFFIKGVPNEKEKSSTSFV